MATAAFYGILSDTQDLDREASRADVEACRRLFPLVLLDTLGKLRHPPRERDYYRTIARAMQHVMVGKNTCVCHVGPVSNPEVVAEVADFLVAMKQITWCLVSGLVEGSMVLSLRTTHPDGAADQLMSRLLRGLGAGGGHGMMAGGAVACADAERYRQLAERISARFLEGLPRRTPEILRPLTAEA
jgi:nanoRNase/pAp phosphatase (c-di-AMP/oligoRNAs hydrolase)